MSKKNIMDICEGLDGLMFRNKSNFSNFKSNWLIYDKNNNPYLAVIKSKKRNMDAISDASNSNLKNYYKMLKIVDYKINVYEIKPNGVGISIDFKKPVSSTLVSTEDLFKEKQLILHSIIIDDKNFARLGLGTAMLEIVDQLGLQVDYKNIVGTINAYDFMKGKYKQVKEFYNKNDYVVEGFSKEYYAENPNNTTSDYDDRIGELYKNLNDKTLHRSKLKTIKYPMYHGEINVIVPNGKIVSSGYYGIDEVKDLL